MKPSPITLYVDADACPVKEEVYRVAGRHAQKGTAIKVVVVSNSPIAVPRDLYADARPDGKPASTFPGRAVIARIVVGSGIDEADDYIAARARRGDIVVTADIPLAARAVKAGADAIAPDGKAFSEDSIGMTLATRNLLSELRSAGAITGGPKPFAPADRSRFLSALDRAIVRLTRAGFGAAEAG